MATSSPSKRTRFLRLLRRGALVLALGALLPAVLTSGCRGGAPAARPQVAAEEVPEGVGLLHVSATYEELLEKAKPDLAWEDADHARFLLWVKGSWAKPDEYRGTFTMARAYRFARGGKPFWALLEPLGSWPAGSKPFGEWPRALQKFSSQKHVLEELACPTPHNPDGNYSSVELLVRNDAGAAVFEVVYASTSGDRAHQEEMGTGLIYMAPNGTLRLAASDLPCSRIFTGWWVGTSMDCELKIAWTPGGAAPFRATVREGTNEYVTCAPAHIPPNNIPMDGYTEYREGVLAGPFPLQRKMSEEYYVEGDGQFSLNQLADTLMAFHSDWIFSWIKNGWAKPEDKELVTSQWRSELQRLNPGLDAEAVVPQKQKIVAPMTGKVNDRIIREVKERRRAREAVKQ